MAIIKMGAFAALQDDGEKQTTASARTTVDPCGMTNQEGQERGQEQEQEQEQQPIQWSFASL